MIRGTKVRMKTPMSGARPHKAAVITTVDSHFYAVFGLNGGGFVC